MEMKIDLNQSQVPYKTTEVIVFGGQRFEFVIRTYEQSFYMVNDTTMTKENFFKTKARIQKIIGGN